MHVLEKDEGNSVQEEDVEKHALKPRVLILLSPSSNSNILQLMHILHDQRLLILKERKGKQSVKEKKIA